MSSTTTFELTPVGPFSLAASSRFLEGFAPAAYDASAMTGLEMAFCVDGRWDPVAVCVHEERDRVVGTIQAADDVAAEVVAVAVPQVERILSLDVDGEAFPDVGRRDRVVGRLQARYPGLRPVCFWSPYEAAAWAVIGQRIRIVQAATIKTRMAEEFGETVEFNGRLVHAFPAPATLAEITTCAGLNETKVERLQAVAQAALAGILDAENLRSMPRTQALDELRTITGIGPFSAELILLRGAGDPDHTPTSEPRLARAIAMAYDLAGPPNADDVAAISQTWAPYRSWVSLLLRTMLEDETHEITGHR